MAASNPAYSHQMEWTEEEYLLFEKDSDTKHEFLGGEVYAMAGAKSRHNVIAMNVGSALVQLVRRGPCAVFGSDQRIHIAQPKKFYTYADGGVCCGTWQISARDGMSLENPSLLFEVLSPTTRKYDRGGKLLLYMQIPTLTDILLIDQPEHHIEHHQRGSRGWKKTVRRRGAISVLGGILQIEDLYNVPPGLPED